MPLSRSPRMDRRRRALREGWTTAADAAEEGRSQSQRASRGKAEDAEGGKKDRMVAYSHSVRRTCQHRLVQFIPVRRLSLTGAVLASLAMPAVLIALHYFVFVSGQLPWSQHPMSTLINANHPRSLAAWLCSHLWLLCLASTILTFRLRKHKLDDYDGEYRLWFWLVFTCIIGSIDSTTRLTELFGAALDRWSQVHVGWTGGAIVQATLATLIGLLGLRLCGELKAVPSCVVLWLGGLSCWAVSAALGQSLLRLELLPATRDWLRGSFWLGGMTAVWLCGLFFLRAVFMEAQQRFLSRSALAARPTVSWRERLNQSMSGLPGFGRRDEEADEEEDEEELDKAARNKSRRRKSQRDTEADLDESEEQEPAESTAGKAKRGWGLSRLMLRPKAVKNAELDDQVDNSDDDTDQSDEQATGKRTSWFGRRAQPSGDARSASPPQETSRQPVVAKSAAMKSTQDEEEDDESESASSSKRSWRDRLRWSRRQSTDADTTSTQTHSRAAQEEADDDATTETKRKWLKLPKPKMPKLAIPKPKLPKFKLPSFRLPPPTFNDADDDESGGSQVPAISGSRAVPGTSGPAGASLDSDASRGLSKAERKRLRKLQRDDESDRRAA